MVYSQVHYSPPTKRLVVHLNPFSAGQMGGVVHLGVMVVLG